MIKLPLQPSCTQTTFHFRLDGETYQTQQVLNIRSIMICKVCRKHLMASDGSNRISIPEFDMKPKHHWWFSDASVWILCNNVCEYFYKQSAHGRLTEKYKLVYLIYTLCCEYTLWCQPLASIKKCWFCVCVCMGGGCIANNLTSQCIIFVLWCFLYISISL